MRIVTVFHGVDRPMESRSVASPEPRGSEVLVRVICCTLCRSDLHTHAGRRQEPTPTVLGHEIVGRVEAFGPDAARLDGAGRPVEEGSRITWAIAVGCGSCFFCEHDLPQKCERPFKYGHHRMDAERCLGGGLAEFVLLVPGTAWYRVPEEIPDALAAQANCATATAACLLRQSGAIADSHVLILGGGVLGLTACAMVRAAGARTVIVVDPEPTCRERASAFGATTALAADPRVMAAGVAEHTHGRGADFVFELAGRVETVRASLDLARTGGTVILAGTVAPVGTVAMDPEQVVRRMLTIRGVHNYHPRDLETALDFLAGPGRAYPFADLIIATFGLRQTESALAEAHARPGLRVAVRPKQSESGD